MDKLENLRIIENVTDAKELFDYAKTVVIHISDSFFGSTKPDMLNIERFYNDIINFLNISIHFLHDGIKLLENAEENFSLQNSQDTEPERETERR